MMRIKQKLTKFIILAFISMSAFADLKNHIEDGKDLDQGITNVTTFIATLFSSIFGAVALIAFMFIGFVFIKDKDKAKEMIESWVGAVIFFAFAGAIVSGIFAAVS